MRRDVEYSHVSAWEWQGDGQEPTMHREQLEFEHVPPSQRSYK